MSDASMLAMSVEVKWLTLTIIMTAVMWMPYILNRIFERGLLDALWDPQGITDTGRDWARRMMKAHRNAVENLVVFAPLVILVETSGLNSAMTAWACMLYFYARLAHFLVYSFGIPVLRTLAFLTGFTVQVMLAMRLTGYL